MEDKMSDMMSVRYVRIERIEMAAPRVKDTEQLARDIFMGTGLSKLKDNRERDKEKEIEYFLTIITTHGTKEHPLI